MAAILASESVHIGRIRPAPPPGRHPLWPPASPHVAAEPAGQAEQTGAPLEVLEGLDPLDSPCWRAQSSAPGSRSPLRVAITSPSSGVKPMVVSTDRPPATAVTDAPPPRWQTITRSPCLRRRHQGVGPADRPGATEPMEAVAADTPAGHPVGRNGVGGAGGAARPAWKAVSKQATEGTFGQEPPGRVDAGERRRVVQGGQVVQLFQVVADLVGDHHRFE